MGGVSHDGYNSARTASAIALETFMTTICDSNADPLVNGVPEEISFLQGALRVDIMPIHTDRYSAPIARPIRSWRRRIL